MCSFCPNLRIVMLITFWPIPQNWSSSFCIQGHWAVIGLPSFSNEIVQHLRRVPTELVCGSGEWGKDRKIGRNGDTVMGSVKLGLRIAPAYAQEASAGRDAPAYAKRLRGQGLRVPARPRPGPGPVAGIAEYKKANLKIERERCEGFTLRIWFKVLLLSGSGMIRW